MTAMTDTITRQVLEQVKRAMEAMNSARPLPQFDYVLPPNVSLPTGRTTYCLLVVQSGSGRCLGRTRVVDPIQSNMIDMRQQGLAAAPYRGKWPSLPLLPLPMRLTPSGLPDSKNKSRLPSLEEPAQPQPRDEECSTEVMATIAGGYAEGMTHSAWKAQLRGSQQLLTIEQGTRITVPTMVFGGKEAPRFASLHNDPLVVEMKIASIIVRPILIDMSSSVDTIT
ncbi:hypothetical protein Cgig2_009901 [Carnegiea gigantea]|uniref:Uncharacterized protein n=1 Tax=Carnegiea gigantea TaxID=171969 RepID=A0A9Q1K9F2_9CARY|nr:hypothetical protein Cgig2_009901 [Carnegiea gigantea]